MRAIATPNQDAQAVYQACVNSIADYALRSRLEALTSLIGFAASDYKMKGREKKLYTLTANDCENEDYVICNVTKSELKNVYTTYMVGKARPARSIYDEILSRAPLGRCPFCGMGHASTLDHYLPKSKYPLLSVVPLNLVPCCKDCNTGKRTSIFIKEEEQVLHPYLDENPFTIDQWLFAEVLPTEPEAVSYFVRAPEFWDEISKKRIEAHFAAFNLARRFSIEAANELANQRQFLDDFKRKYGNIALLELLADQVRSHLKAHVNSWQTALYQALIEKNREPTKTTEKLTETCPACEGEGVFVNYSCPCCQGNRFVSRRLLAEINMSDYEFLKCPECDGRERCHICLGKGIIPRAKALQLTRNRP